MTTASSTTAHRTFPVAAPVEVSVRLARGAVTITAGDVTEAVVDLRPAHPGGQEALELIARARVELHGNSLVIHVPEHLEGFRFGRTPAVLVRAEVPTDSDVTAVLGAADISLTGRVGDLRVRSGSGDVTATESGDTSIRSGKGRVDLGSVADVAVTTAAGDITVRHVRGDFELHTASGDIHVALTDRDGRAVTGAGRIVLDRTSRGSVSLKTAAGSVQVRHASEGDLSVNTVSGDITIGITEGTVARLDCTSVTGQVRSHLQPTDAPSADERRLFVAARSVTGSVTVQRATD